MIVEAVAVSANAAGTNKKSALARVVEKAMSEAISQAYAAGVIEPEEISIRMHAAREQAKADFYKQGGEESNLEG